MKASVPGVIENVRVADINQGSNPIRILSLRALPNTHVKELRDSIHEANKKNKDPQEAAADEEGGDYYNLEASFAYHAAPSGETDTSSKARNMHMQLVFYLGQYNFMMLSNLIILHGVLAKHDRTRLLRHFQISIQPLQLSFTVT